VAAGWRSCAPSCASRRHRVPSVSLSHTPPGANPVLVAATWRWARSSRPARRRTTVRTSPRTLRGVSSRRYSHARNSPCTRCFTPWIGTYGQLLSSFSLPPPTPGLPPPPGWRGSTGLSTHAQPGGLTRGTPPAAPARQLHGHSPTYTPSASQERRSSALRRPCLVARIYGCPLVHKSG